MKNIVAYTGIRTRNLSVTILLIKWEVLGSNPTWRKQFFSLFFPTVHCKLLCLDSFSVQWKTDSRDIWATVLCGQGETWQNRHVGSSPRAQKKSFLADRNSSFRGLDIIRMLSYPIVALRLLTQCLKITEKVSFNIASEASNVYKNW